MLSAFLKEIKKLKFKLFLKIILKTYLVAKSSLFSMIKFSTSLPIP